MRDPHPHPAPAGGPDASADDDALARQLFPLDDASGPALRRSAAELDAILSGALEVHFAAAPSAGTPAQPASPAGTSQGASPLGRLRLVLVCAALVGGALVALWLSTRAPRDPVAGTAPVDPQSGVLQRDHAAHGADASGHAATTAADADPALAESPDPTSELLASPDALVAPDDGAAPAPSRATTPARPASDPRDLLREANALRGQSQFVAAERLYLRVVREHPGSSSAYVAKVAAASLRLERLGNPGGAISLYRGALRDNPSGSLSQEIRRGLALATRRSGQRDAEQRALRDFLGHHGSAPFAPAARARLAELDATP